MDEEILKEIADIYEIEKVSIFPLAPIYYIAFLVILISILAIVYFLKRKREYRKSWRYLAKIELETLQNKSEITNRELFLFVKKVAVQKFKRSEIANLHGEDLISWLKENFSKKLNWNLYKKHVMHLFDKEPIILTGDNKKIFLDELSKWI